ncbi:O-methyltransferase gsfB [Lasiodiplodia hormozganensis]|uniref:O-methyltransferase gsfB n=1 Tax=Lasiodiplodia hormozganensis TaxID=869390 RepID=A0AA39Z310_9PEZI|nr:O-methyltransferase gsfB [Lasiodiplodia hormozganensis]
MSLTALAEVILANAKELDQRGVVDVESKIGFRDLTQSDLDCRACLITAIREMHRMALGPAETIYNMLMSSTGDITSLLALARYDIPAKVPTTGSTSFAALAEHTAGGGGALDAETLARLLRNAIVEGIFAEPSPGQIQHTPTSRLLQNPDFAALVGFYAEENGGAAGSTTLDALARWRCSREPACTGFALANAGGRGGEGGTETGAYESFFAELAKDPARVKRAAGAFNALPQMLVQGQDGLSRSPLWRELDESAAAQSDGFAVVVDVGGNRGHASMALADATTERVRFVVEDLPGPVALGEEGLPERYRGRVSFRIQDFFKEQGVKHADVYFLRKVMHDFPDHYCVKIIRALIPALKEGARVVVCDRLMPEASKAGYEQREARFSDLAMLQLLNGRERSETDWKKLFADADSRFEIEFEHWTGNLHGLVIATWRP